MSHLACPVARTRPVLALVTLVFALKLLPNKIIDKKWGFPPVQPLQ
jgi:hypothetical protein